VRNGMGKTTLCKTIWGWCARPRLGPDARRELLSLQRHRSPGLVSVTCARAALWRLSHCRRTLAHDPGMRRGAWTVERIYGHIPAPRRAQEQWRCQLSGREQQMLAIARALVTNPRL